MSASVFPARAGMSPVRKNVNAAIARVPRASGDEPRQTGSRFNLGLCSPRERG